MSQLAEFSALDTECLKQNRIGILGGTFNPIHNGHIKMAYIAMYEFGLGRIMFLPTGNPPHKKDELLPCAADRLEMVRLAIEEESRFFLSSAETDRTGYTYTVDTLELLSRKDSQTAFYYIIGADTLFELTSWKNHERVFLLTDFICILRPGHDFDQVMRYVDMLNNRFGHKVYVAEERGPDISSTQIRRLLAENRLPEGLIAPKVAKYIIKHDIYGQRE